MELNILDTSRIRKLLFLGPKGSYSDFAKNNFINKIYFIKAIKYILFFILMNL